MQIALDNPAARLEDALCTVAVNSAHKASRALSKWFKHGVKLTTNGFERISLTELSSAVGDPDEPVAALHMALSGALGGDILLAFPEQVALRLVDVLIGAAPGTSKRFGDLEISCLQETGNIVGSAFANSLASWLRVDVLPLSPVFAHDLAGAIVQPLLMRQAAAGDDVLVARTEFTFDGQRLDWRLLLLPTAEAMATMKQQCDSRDIQRRALQTIAVNGAFDASRAMSKWLRRGVRLSTEGFRTVPIREAAPSYDDGEPVVALHSVLGHQMNGHTLAMMSLTAAMELVDLLTGREPGTTDDLDEMGKSCLQETGNIIASAFMNSWGKWLEVFSEPQTPTVLIDLPRAIFESVLSEQAKMSDEIFMAETEFSLDGRSVQWRFYVLPTPSSLRLIEASCRA